MRKALFKFYWKLEAALTPSLRFSQSIYEDALRSVVDPSTVWLDLGCGHQVLPPWRAEQEKQLVSGCRWIVGFDCDMSALRKHTTISNRVVGNIAALPFADGSFHLVTANMVVEHLDRPEEQFREAARVLKPGGIFLFHTPNALGYPVLMSRWMPQALKRKLVYLLEGRREEDVFETYYRANTRKQVRCLAMLSGFEVEKLRMIATSAVFSIIPPLVILELLYIRFLMTDLGKPLRTNIIGILRKK